MPGYDVTVSVSFCVFVSVSLRRNGRQTANESVSPNNCSRWIFQQQQKRSNKTKQHNYSRSIATCAAASKRSRVTLSHFVCVCDSQAHKKNTQHIRINNSLFRLWADDILFQNEMDEFLCWKRNAIICLLLLTWRKNVGFNFHFRFFINIWSAADIYMWWFKIVEFSFVFLFEMKMKEKTIYRSICQTWSGKLIIKSLNHSSKRSVKTFL